MSRALLYGESAVFFRDRMPEAQSMLSSKGLCLDRSSASSAIRHNELDPDLQEILVDVTGVAALFNDLPKGSTIDLSTFQEMLYSICYRLIRFLPLNSSKRVSNIEAVYHIGLTVFTMTLFLQFDNRRILDFELVFLRLKDILDRGLDESDSDLLLWLMFVGGIWISGGIDESWLMSRIRKLASRVNIFTWADVHSSVTAFPWIHAIHDRPARAVWDVVDQRP